MTALTLTSAAPPGPFRVLTVMSAVLLALTALWALADDRTIDGVAVWAKPMKFALSFVVHFATLALIAARLPAAVQAGRPVRLAAAAMAVSFAGEMAWMTFQAARAEASHFNLATPFTFAMYGLMALGATVLVVAPLVVARAARRAGDFGPATRAGIWWGALLSAVLTLVAGFTLGAQSGHFIGTPSTPPVTLPLIGWSAEVGDLRPAHFMALHALQALPLLGLWLDRRGRGAGPVIPAVALWAMVTAALFIQALAGLPLLRL